MNLSGYSLLEGFDGRFQKYEITSVREGAVLYIIRWRNAQIDALRQKTPLTEDKQLHYFREVVFPTFEMEEPTMIILAFLKQGKLMLNNGVNVLSVNFRPSGKHNRLGGITKFWETTLWSNLG